MQKDHDSDIYLHSTELDSGLQPDNIIDLPLNRQGFKQKLEESRAMLIGDSQQNGLIDIDSSRAAKKLSTLIAGGPLKWAQWCLEEAGISARLAKGSDENRDLFDGLTDPSFYRKEQKRFERQARALLRGG